MTLMRRPEFEPPVETRERRWRKQIPDAHRTSLDTRVMWLWNQKFGVAQMVYLESNDILDRTAATLILQAIMGPDLVSIEQVIHRIEGGAREDSVLAEEPERIRM